MILKILNLIMETGKKKKTPKTVSDMIFIFYYFSFKLREMSLYYARS